MKKDLGQKAVPFHIKELVRIGDVILQYSVIEPTI